MKWYFAINEQGTGSKVGWHARLAVASALSVGGLEPILVYSGNPNSFTDWMEAQGVTILWRQSRLYQAMTEIAGRSPGYLTYSGHWLRTDICLLETEAEFVVYTDCDVVFLRRPDLSDVRPQFIACAPELLPQNWNYFNSGVMVMNIPALRREHEALERFIITEMQAAGGTGFLDQEAYNHFYRRRWTRLDPRFNWKPYWGYGGDRLGEAILHFHGPKLPEMKEILAGSWPWEDPVRRGLGGMLLSALSSYQAYVRLLAEGRVPLPGDIALLLEEILDLASRFDPAPYQDGLAMSWERRMFADD